ncbi:MAG: hypothetical protein ACKVJE_17230 [Pseudomonadales bacterium]
MNLSSFGARMHYARTTLNRYSATDVAKYSAVTRMTITGWEKKETADVNALSLQKACDYYKISIEWAITGRGNIQTTNDCTTVRKLPLISLNDVIDHAAGKKEAQEIKEIEVANYINSGPRDFIVRVEKDFSVEFHAGDTIICNPDMKPENANYILYHSDSGTTIASYIELPGNRKHISGVDNKESLEQFQADRFIATICGKWFNY